MAEFDKNTNACSKYINKAELKNCAHSLILSGCGAVLCTGKMHEGIVPLHLGVCNEWEPKEEE